MHQYVIDYSTSFYSDHRLLKLKVLSPAVFPEHWNSPGMCPFPAFIHYIHDWLFFQSLFRNTVKFADDTTLEGHMTNSNEFEYCHEVNKLVSWVDNNKLQLNAS